MRWWRRIWRREPFPSDVYVIVERGEPSLVCLDHATTQREAFLRDPRWTRIFRVNVERGSDGEP